MSLEDRRPVRTSGPGVWARHRGWIRALAAVPVTYLAITFLLFGLEPDFPNAELSWQLELLLLSSAVVPAIFLVVAGVKAYRAVRDGHRRRRAFMPAELRRPRDKDAYRRAEEDARELRRTLLAHEMPATLPVWDVVPYADEVFLCDAPAGYARYYGAVVEYTQTSGFFYGNPAFVMAAIAANKIENRSRRSAAERLAREQWREHAQCRLVVSDQRLIVQVHGRWLSFDYAAMTAVYPEPENWALVCQFTNSEPLLLTGPHAPFAAVMTLYATHGKEALHAHPALASW